MTTRLALGSVAALLALSAAPASANHVFACEPGFELICRVADTSERIVCNPRYITC